MARHSSSEHEIAWAKWVGDAVRKAREANSMSRNQLSRAADCSPNNIQKVEEGNSPGIGFLMLARLAARLSLEIDVLYGNFAERNSSQ